MLAPRGAAYAGYADIRQSIALPENHAAADQSHRRSRSPVWPASCAARAAEACSNRGKLAFVANVGTLVEPSPKPNTTPARRLPLGLFSHSDQIEQWQTSIPDNRSGIGWGGRMADLLKSLNSRGPLLHEYLARRLQRLAGRQHHRRICHPRHRSRRHDRLQIRLDRRPDAHPDPQRRPRQPDGHRISEHLPAEFQPIEKGRHRRLRRLHRRHQCHPARQRDLADHAAWPTS